MTERIDADKLKQILAFQEIELKFRKPVVMMTWMDPVEGRQFPRFASAKKALEVQEMLGRAGVNVELHWLR